MNKKSYFKQVIFSFLFLSILVSALFYSSEKIRDILINPYKYLKLDIPITEIHFLFVFICLIVIAVFFSFIFYLLITARTRFQLQIFEATKTVSISAEQFKKLYDYAPIPYIMLGKNAEIHNPNKAALRFFGVVQEEIEDKNLFSYISEENKDQGEMLFQYYKNNISLDKKEIQMTTKSGAVRSVLLSIFEIKNPKSFSRDTGIAMIFDVTEQKLLDKSKTEFLSLASHQLRSPLSTIKWYAETLIAGDLGELNPKQKDLTLELKTINREMAELVEVLLNVSRIEMGSLLIDIKETNVKDLTESILSEMIPQIEKKKIVINKKYYDFLQNTKSDPKLLRIVIHNLISNAIKYTPNEGTVTIIFEESNNGKKIIISDTGIGIPKEEQKHIFSKSFRANNARNSSAQGTGLGLYLIKSIMESINGKIEFISEENFGSTFTITL